MTVLEVLRAANVALLAACIVGLLLRWTMTWPTLTRGGRLIRTGFLVLLVAGVTGSAIKYLTRAPMDASIAIVTLASVLILIGLWLSRADQHHPWHP